MTLHANCWTAALEAEVGEILAREDSGHDIHHALRVRRLGIWLASLTGADPVAVEAMALLHDVGHASGRENHAAIGAQAAAEILERIGFPKSKIAMVVRCIEHHHWKLEGAGDLPEPPLEYRVFVDADRLDALGAIGVARAFAFGGAHRRAIWEPDGERQPASRYGRSSVDHFFDKLLRLEQGMYTPAAQELAARRTSFLREFLNAFFSEWELRDLSSSVEPARSPEHRHPQALTP